MQVEQMLDEGYRVVKIEKKETPKKEIEVEVPLTTAEKYKVKL